MDSNHEEENNDQGLSQISDHQEIHIGEDEPEKLNINTKKIDSSRDEMIQKEEKTEEKNTKDNAEKTIDKETQEKKGEEKEGEINTKENAENKEEKKRRKRRKEK